MLDHLTFLDWLAWLSVGAFFIYLYARLIWVAYFKTKHESERNRDGSQPR